MIDREKSLEKTIIALPYLWLALFFLAPFFIILKISLADPVLALPPYTPMFDTSPEAVSRIHITFDNFRFVWQDSLYLLTYWSSLKIAAISTLLVLLVGYPMAYAIARAPKQKQSFLLMLVILPFWTSFLLRVYAWMGLLNTHGLINKMLLGLGITETPLNMMYTDFAVYLGIVYSYLPFMILPLYASLQKLDEDLLDAASDLGAGPIRRFFDVTLPLSGPGIIAGCMLV